MSIDLGHTHNSQTPGDVFKSGAGAYATATTVSSVHSDHQHQRIPTLTFGSKIRLKIKRSAPAGEEQ